MVRLLGTGTIQASFASQQHVKDQQKTIDDLHAILRRVEELLASIQGRK